VSRGARELPLRHGLSAARQWQRHVRREERLGTGRYTYRSSVVIEDLKTGQPGWRPGIYLVRLTQGPRSLIAGACIVR